MVERSLHGEGELSRHGAASTATDEVERIITFGWVSVSDFGEGLELQH